jgi:hypothetical protein
VTRPAHLESETTVLILTPPGRAPEPERERPPLCSICPQTILDILDEYRDDPARGVERARSLVRFLSATHGSDAPCRGTSGSARARSGGSWTP